ncbi:hypothetical protein Dda_5688 [Drechslerella dactyloides]|uniref:Uncharacterized protein n=1 Tax=Drechslerella dactyloides TaxID=74499 RepID=A0AAD6IX96_DREDA|nr:hypothetical protein Dda_5688 [Drechslerella dactyloides]
MHNNVSRKRTTEDKKPGCGIELVTDLCGATHFNLLSLDADPFKTKSSYDAQTHKGDRDVESLRQAEIVGAQDPRKKFGGESGFQACSTGNQNNLGVEVWNFRGQVLQELVVKDVLCNRHSERTAEGLREDDDGSTGSDIP